MSNVPLTTQATTYLFHHKNQQINTNTIKHNDPIVSIEWPIDQQSNDQKDNDIPQNQSWNTQLYKSMIKTKWLSQTFAFSDCMESTQTFTKDNAKLLPNGTLTLANKQTKGKGRGNNIWTSPEGCLLFSFITNLDASKVKSLVTMQYIISIAMVDTILKLTNNRIQIQLKWPNDIYYNNLKIGGVLCQSEYCMNTKKYIITHGIGLNVSNKYPTICINDIINDNKLILKREQILSTFVNIFEIMYEYLINNGFQTELKKKYLKYWIHSGQKVVVDQDVKGINKNDNNNSNSGNMTLPKIEMFITGISDDGLLLGQNKNGEIFELHPDGNSFDFLQGLVCRKPHTL